VSYDDWYDRYYIYVYEVQSEVPEWGDYPLNELTAYFDNANTTLPLSNDNNAEYQVIPTTLFTSATNTIGILISTTETAESYFNRITNSASWSYDADNEVVVGITDDTLTLYLYELVPGLLVVVIERHIPASPSWQALMDALGEQFSSEESVASRLPIVYTLEILPELYGSTYVGIQSNSTRNVTVTLQGVTQESLDAWLAALLASSYSYNSYSGAYTNSTNKPDAGNYWWTVIENIVLDTETGILTFTVRLW